MDLAVYAGQDLQSDSTVYRLWKKRMVHGENRFEVRFVRNLNVLSLLRSVSTNLCPYARVTNVLTKI